MPRVKNLGFASQIILNEDEILLYQQVIQIYQNIYRFNVEINTWLYEQDRWYEKVHPSLHFAIYSRFATHYIKNAQHYLPKNLFEQYKLRNSLKEKLSSFENHVNSGRRSNINIWMEQLLNDSKFLKKSGIDNIVNTDEISSLIYDIIDKANREPIKISEKFNLWIFKDYQYEISGSYHDEDIKLLIIENFDKERRYFERLRNTHEQKITSSQRRPRIPENIRIEVWRRDGGKCVRCNSRVNLEYDHIIPLSKGGSNTVRNIELLCQNCNRTKGADIGIPEQETLF